MALPLPKVVSDVGPGGGIVTGMRGMNALSQDMLDTQIKGVQAQYAPLTTQAEAASKLAYANLMGPQFLSKLMGNQDILANIPDNQKNAILQKLQQAGMGGGTGNALMGGMPMPQQGNNSLSGWLTDKLKNIFGGGDQPQQGQQQPFAQQQSPFAQPQPQQASPNAFLQNPNLSAQDRNAISTMQPGQAYTIQGNQGGPASPPQSAPPSMGQTPTFSENVGNYKGVVQEGQEAGKIRANDIKDLNDMVFNAETKQATFDDINNMISSPEIREIRQLPLAGRHEMGWYAKEGTPAQQQLVGRLYAQLGNVIKDSSRDFAGQFRKGEQQLLQGMKPSDSDTVDTMIGKAESLTTMNKLLMERARLTSQYMNQYHINKGQAAQMADQQVNGEDIRQQVHDKLNPTITLRNPKTGELVTIPVSEARQGGFKGG